MILVTRLHDGDEVLLNAELIETIEARPDTIITITTGKKILVRESVTEVVRKIIEYRQVIRPIIRTNAPVDNVDYTLITQPVDLFEAEKR